MKLVEVFVDEIHAYLVMELCQGGELFDRISARDGAKMVKNAENPF